jgi:acyl transferase domain-containing protein
VDANDPDLLDALKKSIVALKQAKERVRELESRESIAIVGMGCRFAGGVSSPDAFWSLLDAGVDAVGPVPRDRWNADELFDPDPSASGKSTTREGGFLGGDVYGFDPAFFGITPREALGMDPQQRLLMEVVWESLEHAGIVPASLMGSGAGVFVGTNFQEYASLASELPTLDGYALTGVHPSVASGRISYFLGAKGPSVTLDTACSSSLVAVHFACQSIGSGECDVAIAGGSGLMLTPSVFVEFSRLRGLAKNGRSKAFDAAADGMGWGEGCGVVVLERLSSALAAGRRVHAVIRGSAVNQDGRSHGLTAPNGPSQRQLITKALERAAVAPAEIAYVEAHGAGTALGDPIEMQALGEALSPGRTTPVLVGSVKTNIGHTMAAAGVAGLIKTVLAMRHQRIPRSLHLSNPSPHIAWDTLPVRVATEATPWPRGDKRRVAGVSSFGVSGTNAHVVVEEPPLEETHAAAKDRAAHVLVVSAKTPDALALAAERWAEHLDADVALGDVCHAAATTRTHFEERLCVVASSREEARAKLRAGGVIGKARTPKVAFLFTGQGSQYVGMGRDLYETEPVFREALDRCAKITAPLLEKPLLEVLYPNAGESPLDETRYTQPALFAVEYALASLWMSWGIVPDVVMGHSVGEYVAACIAGVFSLEDGLKLITARGRLMHALPPDGEMASVKTDLGRVARALSADVSIGAYNGPEAIVVSGRKEAVRAVCRELEAEGIKTKTLAVSIASHSPLMDPMLDDLERVARDVTFHAPRITFVSNVTGAVAGAEVATPAYWRRHVREAVRFDEGMRAIRALGVDTFVEAGPQPTLLGMGAACVEGCEWLPSLKKDDPTYAVLLDSLGTLHVRGAKVAWSAFDAPFARKRVSAPTYAFDRKTYRASRGKVSGAKTGSYALSGDRIAVPGGALHRALRIGPAHQPWLNEHRVHGRIAIPGSFHITAILAAASDAFGASSVTLRDVHFMRPLVVDDETTLHIVLAPTSEGEFRFELCTASGVAAWHVHVEGLLVLGGPPAESSFRATCNSEVAVDALFDRFAAIEMGSGWRWIENAFDGDGYSRAHVRAPEDASDRDAPLHPILLDNCFAAATLALPSNDTPHLLWRIEEMRVRFSAAREVWCHARASDGSVVDLNLVDDAGAALVSISGATFKRAERDAFSRLVDLPVFEVAWPKQPAVTHDPPRGRWLVVADDPKRGDQLAARLVSATVSSIEESGPFDNVVVWWRAGGDAMRIAREALLAIQATARRQEKPRLFFVTEGAQAVAPSDRIDVHASVVWGLGRAAMEEHPELRCTLVDLDPDDTSLDPLVSALANDDPELALRAGVRHVARLVPARAAATRASLVPENASVLVTGGLGALGLRVASFLAEERGVRHLVLVGRSAPTGDRLARIEALRAKGVSVAVHQADVARADDLERVLTTIRHPLRGIVHAAGIVDGEHLVRLDPARLDAVLRPKVLGAWNLHALTRDLPLDFFVLFSSIQSIVTSASQGNYAAANAFLDALAHHRKRAGMVAQSLDWGAWSGEGMAARLDEVERVRLARVGFGALQEEAALSLLARAMDRPEAQLVLASIDTSAIEDAPILRTLARPRRRLAASLRQRLVGLSQAERERVIVDVVRAEVAAALRLEGPAAVPLDRPLKELGLDSLIAVELPNRLRALSGEPMPATLLYDHPTVSAVAAFIDGKIKGEAKAPLPNKAAVENDAIAIVAMACRAPGGCATPDALWDLVARGESAITAPPAHRGWDQKSHLGGFLHEADAFDAHFFDLSEREATLMDPQQRLLLEVSWEALERAGITAFEGSRTGVFLGVTENGYAARAHGSPDAHDRMLSLGNRASVASARIAYALGLRGPVMTVDTACSSSLVSLHLACQSLRARECDLALAGGATVLATPDLFVESSGHGTLSPEGRCKPFADSADGVVWSEGVGVLALERVRDARKNGHPILALVRGSALNHDGRGQGLTTPNGTAQREVISLALRAARLEASDVDVLEAHGTGTHIGDAIEAAAIVDTYGRARGAPIIIGNVKPFIGHTQSAAGVLGVVHTVVSMQRERLPAMPNAGISNRNVDWSAGTVRVADRERPWQRGERPRRAAVSAFGVGTNAHVIVEEAPGESPRAPAGAPREIVIVVSGKTVSALREQAQRMAAFLERSDADLHDVAYSAAVHRTHFRERAAIIAERREEAITMLRAVEATCVLGNGELTAIAEKYVRGESIEWTLAGRFVPLPAYAFERSRHWLEAKAPAPIDDALVARLRVMSDEDRRPHLLDLVRTETAAVLGLPDPGSIVVDRSLFQLGVDSLRGTRLKNRLAALTGVALPATLVFEHPTIEGIVERLSQALSEPTYEEFDV